MRECVRVRACACACARLTRAYHRFKTEFVEVVEHHLAVITAKYEKGVVVHLGVCVSGGGGGGGGQCK